MNFPGLVLKIPLTMDLVATVLFVAVTFFVVVISGILFFHWRKYSLSKVVSFGTEAVYLVVVFILLSTAFASL